MAYGENKGYRSSNNISRNFTDAELAVDERVTSLLTQPVSSMPPALISAGGTAEQSYAWLKQDLEERDKATQRLTQEMQLANQQSIRYQLGEEAKLDTEQKNEASSYISKLTKWRESGYTSPDAYNQALLEENSNLTINPFYNEQSRNFLSNSKSDKAREIDENTEAVNFVKSKLEANEYELLMDDFKKNPETWNKFYEDSRKVKMLGLANQVRNIELDNAVNQTSYEIAKKQQELYGRIAEGDETAALTVRGMMKKRGAQIGDIKGLISSFTPKGHVLTMLSDQIYMDDITIPYAGDNEQTNATKTQNDQLIKNSISILTNPSSSEQDKLNAKSNLEDLASDYIGYSSRFKLAEKTKAEVSALGDDIIPAREKFITASNAINKAFLQDDSKSNDGVVETYNNQLVNNAVATVTQMADSARANGLKFDIDNHPEMKKIKSYLQKKDQPSRVFREVNDSVSRILIDMLEEKENSKRVKTQTQSPESGEKPDKKSGEIENTGNNPTGQATSKASKLITKNVFIEEGKAQFGENFDTKNQDQQKQIIESLRSKGYIYQPTQ
jgi:hypothetical protein